MQLVKVNGSAYEIGLELGRLGRSAARDVLPRIGRFQEVVGQWGSSDRLRELEAAARQHFPQHVSTLEGIATGAKQPFDLIFAWNCRGDFPGEATRAHWRVVPMLWPSTASAYSWGMKTTSRNSMVIAG